MRAPKQGRFHYGPGVLHRGTHYNIRSNERLLSHLAPFSNVPTHTQCPPSLPPPPLPAFLCSLPRVLPSAVVAAQERTQGEFRVHQVGKDHADPMLALVLAHGGRGLGC